MFQDVTEFTHHRPVAFGDRELAFQRGRIDDQRILACEQGFQLGAGGVIQRIPINLIAGDRKALPAECRTSTCQSFHWIVGSFGCVPAWDFERQTGNRKPRADCIVHRECQVGMRD